MILTIYPIGFSDGFAYELTKSLYSLIAFLALSQNISLCNFITDLYLNVYLWMLSDLSMLMEGQSVLEF